MANGNPHDRSIRVIVKAKELYESNNPNDEGIMDANTRLVEDGGLESGFGNSNKNFETTVFMNKRICWSIELADPNGEDLHYSVSLSKVFHNPTAGNPNFFNQEELVVNSDTKKVCGTISRSPIISDMDDNYTIEFYVGYSNTTPQGGTQSGMVKLELDPKLRISTT